MFSFSFKMVGKRKDCTPEAQQDKEKVIKPYESLTQHPSVLNAADLHCSPINTTKSLNIVQKCEIAGISEASNIKNIDVDTVYKLVIELSSRVTSLEADLVKKDTEIFSLRKDHANLEKQLNDMRSNKKEEDEEPFLNVLKREIPVLSDAVAKNEKELGELKENLKDLNESVKKPMDEDGNEENPILQEILANQKEEKTNFVKESRKNHLEREHQSQYTMRDTIRVTGVPYKNGENTNDLVRRIAHSIGVFIKNEDISVSHRTGRRMAGRPRAIICRFTRRDTKYQIMLNRKLARHINADDDGNPVSIFIDEKLTPMRANVCKLLRQEKVKHHTKDGKIFITKENTEELTVLDTTEDWINWDRSEKVKMDLGVYPKF